MRVETKVLDGDYRSVSTKDLVRRVKAIGHLEGMKIKAINRELIDTMIETTDGKNERVITMYRNPEDGKYYVRVNENVVCSGETRSACADRALKKGVYTMKDFTRVMKKKG